MNNETKIKLKAILIIFTIGIACSVYNLYSNKPNELSKIVKVKQ